MTRLIEGFSWLYPCSVCATDFRDKIREQPPELDSRKDFALWMCMQHNLVNEKLMKPKFNCTMRRLELVYGRKSLRNTQL